MPKIESVTLSNLHEIMALGNGFMWVVDNGSDLEVGDYLISSAIPGHAMKDLGNYPVSHIVARVVEPVVWNQVSETINGVKHKLVSITFEQFDIHHNNAEIERLKAENEQLKARLIKIEELLSKVQIQ